MQSLCSERLNSSLEEEEDEEDEEEGEVVEDEVVEDEEDEEDDVVRVDRRSDGGVGSVSDSALKNDN